jgi:hypothetical protein
MTETFDTFTRRSVAYNVWAATGVLIFIFMVTGRIAALNIARMYVIGLVVIEVVSLLIVAYLTGTGQSYLKDGELALSANTITVRSNVIDISSIICIKIYAADYKGSFSKFPTDGGNNSLELQTSEAIYKCHFVIKSSAQADKLRHLIGQWKARGVAINV